tara:strand:- start:1466 stop:1879 length:414 start_codon:yes stop_codon:yes gene_type:complete
MSFVGNTEDKLALHELVMSYGDAVSRNDSKDWGNTWSEDAIWSVPNFPGLEKVEGRDQIVKKWEEAMSNYEYIVFVALLGSLTIDGNNAKGTTYTIEVGTDKENIKSQTHGQYHDEFIKLDGRWYFQKRTFSILHTT